MERSIIIHKHEFGCGGIGDFIRASLSFYSFSKRNNIEYYINFEENPHLNKCFNIKSFDINTIDKNKICQLNLMRGIYTIDKTQNENYIKDTLDQIINEKKVYLIKSNAIGFESNDDINNILDDYFTNILLPSDIILDKIKNIYNDFNLTDSQYISVHFRTGDKNMAKNLKQITGHRDSRINLESDNTYNNIINYRENINQYLQSINDYNGEKIVIHSDSNFFKDNITKIDPNYIKLDIKIQHIAESIGDLEINSFIDTIAEFYILAKAKFIILVSSYSGFSHLSSMIYKKKIYTVPRSGYFKMLHCNNINLL